MQRTTLPLCALLAALALLPTAAAVKVGPIEFDPNIETSRGGGTVCAGNDPYWNEWTCVLYRDDEDLCVLGTHTWDGPSGGGVCTARPYPVILVGGFLCTREDDTYHCAVAVVDGRVCQDATRPERGDEWQSDDCTP